MRALICVRAGLPFYCHAANSAALLRDSRVWFDRVRPGLFLYGIGAYASWGPTVANRVPVHASGPYRMPHYRAAPRRILDHWFPEHPQQEARDSGTANCH